MFDFPAKIYRAIIKSGIFLAPFLLLFIRLSFGWDMYVTGHGHLQHVDDMINNFKGWNVPFPKQSVYISGYTEMVGGLILMAGLASRVVAIPLVFNFATAIATASHDNVVNIFKQDFSKIVDDTAFPYLIVSLVILILGPGIISIDGLLKKTAFKKYSAGLERTP